MAVTATKIPIATEILDGGRWGVIWATDDPNVVFKEPIREPERQSEAEAMLCVEASILSQLAHRNVIRLVEKYLCEDGVSVLALERLEGVCLYDQMETAPESIDVKSCIKQSLEAFAYL